MTNFRIYKDEKQRYIIQFGYARDPNYQNVFLWRAATNHNIEVVHDTLDSAVKELKRWKQAKIEKDIADKERLSAIKYYDEYGNEIPISITVNSCTLDGLSKLTIYDLIKPINKFFKVYWPLILLFILFSLVPIFYYTK